MFIRAQMRQELAREQAAASQMDLQSVTVAACIQPSQTPAAGVCSWTRSNSHCIHKLCAAAATQAQPSAAAAGHWPVGITTQIQPAQIPTPGVTVG